MGNETLKECLGFFKLAKEEFLYKIVLRGIQNTRNFHHGRSERLAGFKTPSSSEVFNNFQVHFVLFSQENDVFVNILS